MIKLINILIAVFLITSGVLGYFIYKQNFSGDKEASQAIQTDKNIVDNKKSENTGFGKDAFKNIPEDKRSLFSFPSGNASLQEYQEHSEHLNSEAVDTTALDVSGCIAKPLVLRAKEGSSLKVKNSSDSIRTIVLSDNETFIVKAKSSIVINYEFGRGPGTYVYGCDGFAGGIFMVN